MSRNSTILIISPHFDDAVLSCGAHILKWRDEGYSVVVVSVFTRGGASGERLYHGRARENHEALRELGATALDLPHIDAPFRFGETFDYLKIISWEATEEIVSSVSMSFRIVCNDLKPELVVCPLAAGNHVDHRVCFLALNRLRPRNVVYYEDRPYAFIREHVAIRTGEPTLFDEGFWLRYFEIYYISSVCPFTQRAAVRKLYAENGLLTNLVPMQRVSVLDASNYLETRLSAIGCYKSEVNRLFSSAEEMRTLYSTLPETLWSSEMQEQRG